MTEEKNELVECDVCGDECEDKATVINPDIEKELKVCGVCLNAFGSKDYDTLTKRLKNNPNHPMNKKVKK